MTKPQSPTMMDLIRMQDVFRRKIYEEERISTPTDTLHALVSGLDVALTILEGSGLEFQGLSRANAERVVDYLQSESGRYVDTNVEIAAYYWAWAETIKVAFLD